MSLQEFYASVQHAKDIYIRKQVLYFVILYLVFISILFQCFIIGNNKCTHKFTLVRYNRNHIDKLVFGYACLYSLRCDIFSVSCLKQVFDAFGNVQHSVFQFSCITRPEEAVFGENFSGFLWFVVVFPHHGFSFHKNLVVCFINPNLNFRHYAANRPNNKFFVRIEAYSCSCFSKTVTHNYWNIYRL